MYLRESANSDGNPRKSSSGIMLLLFSKVSSGLALPGQRTTAEATHDIEPGFKVITIRLHNTLERIHAGIFILDGIPLRILDMRLPYHIPLRMSQICNTDLSAEPHAYMQIIWCYS